MSSAAAGQPFLSIAATDCLQDPTGPVTIRTSKFITNRLLNRKQFVLTVSHPTRANLSRTELGERLAQLYKTEAARVVVFGLRNKFGGGSSQGFGLIYDDEESQKKFEPKYRLIRVSRSPSPWVEKSFADNFLSRALPPRSRRPAASSARSARTAPRSSAAPRRPRPATPRRSKLLSPAILRLLGVDRVLGLLLRCIISFRIPHWEMDLLQH
jgi:small subunit ribosomal protein S24e